MRKVLLQEWISLDGFAAGPAGELDFFTSPELSKGSDEDLVQFIDTIDTILLGAVTYRLFVDFWPTASPDVEIIADKLNATPKLVFSQTLDRAPWGKWPEARVVKHSAAKEIRDQKQRSGKDMVLWGSLSLAQSLMQEGLIDEFHLRITPLVLGGGRRLFADPLAQIPLRLLETKSYDSGLVLLRYSLF